MEMTEREFAIKIRRMLLAVVALIEMRYGLGKHDAPVIQEIGADDSMVSPW
jgi:hypothetical protein